MSMFGWSMPPGCSSTPFDDAGASDLQVKGLPPDLGVFWTEDGDIVLQRFGGEVCQTLHLATLEWDDEKDDEQNFEAARQAAQASLQSAVTALTTDTTPVVNS